jgi:stage II sporulation protein D
MKRFLCIIIFGALLMLFSQPPAGAFPAPNPLLRIGLNCSVSGVVRTVVAASLLNHTGSGYEFGYIDEGMEFVPLGHTSETAITMLPNLNIYLSGGAYGTAPSSSVVGAFHTPRGSFSSREEAESAAGSLRGQGEQAFVSYRNGEWLVRSGSGASSGSGRETGSNRCITVVATNTTDILFQFDYADTYHLAVRPVAPPGSKAQTWHRGFRYFGMFEFRRFNGSGELTVMSVLEMQDYIKGVIPYEMGAAWPIEALKAQAVSARSFAAGGMARHRSLGYNVCDTTHCQVYRGTSAASANSDLAVDETYGMYITFNGQLCATASYHASSGGATEDSENVWLLALPYLRGVADPYEGLINIPGYRWSYEVSNAQIAAYLTQRGVPNNGVSDFYVSRTTRMGNVFSVTVVGTDGRIIRTYEKEAARSFVGGLLRSANNVPSGYAFSHRFSISAPGSHQLTAISSGGAEVTRSGTANLYAIDGSGNILPLPPAETVRMIGRGGAVQGLPLGSNPGGTQGVYAVNGRGHGHNVGMSQWGARSMAELGYSFEQILKHYYTGVEIEVMG